MGVSRVRWSDDMPEDLSTMDVGVLWCWRAKRVDLSFAKTDRMKNQKPKSKKS